MGKANVLTACFAAVLGFATSAVVAEVRGRDFHAVQRVAADVPAQFRPLAVGEAPGFAPSAAPSMQAFGAQAQTIADARATFVSSRTRGWAR